MSEQDSRISEDAAIFTFGDKDNRRRAYVWVEDRALVICYEWHDIVFQSRGLEPDGITRRLELRLFGTEQKASD